MRPGRRSVIVIVVNLRAQRPILILEAVVNFILWTVLTGVACRSRSGWRRGRPLELMRLDWRPIPLSLDGFGLYDVLNGGRVSWDPDPRHSDPGVAGGRPGHDGALLLVLVVILI